MRSLLTVLFVVVLWQVGCQLFSIPAWLLPTPTSVMQVLFSDAGTLFKSFFFTAKVTAASFILALVTGLAVGFLSHVSRGVREGIFPFTILLQTTPVVSVAPLLIVWFRNNAFAALVACAWLVCVYPLISAAYAGFRSTDPNLQRLFRLHGISPWKSFLHFEVPSALPMILNGVRISGGLALVGAIGAEFVAGTGGHELGLAYRLLMAAYNQETAKLFAALFVVSGFGVLIHFLFSALELWVARKLRLGAHQAVRDV
ncbi:MAG: ABC transporter permease [Betaproteobacteria bacterium]|nr:ABC transporter permease [Betaproteobacteria bacterium]